MATRIIRVSNLAPGEYKPSGTLGNHYLVFFPETKRVLGFRNEQLVSIIEVEKDDILIYNCGEIKTMSPWRKRAYNLIGYMPIIITKDVPETHDEGEYCTENHRSARGDFYRRVNRNLCICVTGRSNELFSYSTGYVSRIYARNPEDLFKFLGKKENIALITARYFSLRTYWFDAEGSRV